MLHQSIRHRLVPDGSPASGGQWRAAVLLIGLVITFKALTGLGSMLLPQQAASGPDGLPLDQLNEQGLNMFLSVFRLLGWAQVLSAMIGIVVVARYRSFVPLLCLYYLAETIGKLILLSLYPISSSESAPVASFALIAITLLALASALRGPANPRAPT